MIPPSATLRFEVELISVELPQAEATSFADDNSFVPRTPGAISAAYQSKMAAKEVPKEGLEGFIAWAKKIYVFGFFSSQGEKPPWYLNPLITFPSIFAIVGVGFYLVVALDGVHRGDVTTAGGMSTDLIDSDLSRIIGETVAPMEVGR